MDLGDVTRIYKSEPHTRAGHGWGEQNDQKQQNERRTGQETEQNELVEFLLALVTSPRIYSSHNSEHKTKIENFIKLKTKV